jgi:uncharacterized protein (TIGR02147 family)
MIKIYDYTNYRRFLEDFYREKKSLNPAFSYRNFAIRAGFKAKSFIKMVISGHKNLSEESMRKINRVLKLSPKKFSYFQLIVAFNQAKSVKLRNYYFEKLTSFNARNPGRLMKNREFEYFSRWYHSTIRELVTFKDFDGDYESLGKMVHPRISARQARQSVELLINLGLIKKTKTGYVQTDTLLSTGDEVQSLAVSNFHIQNMALVTEAIDTCSESMRDISGIIMGLSGHSVGLIKSEIQKFRKKLMTIAGSEKSPDRVYHVNFQMFPTSHIEEDL